MAPGRRGGPHRRPGNHRDDGVVPGGGSHHHDAVPLPHRILIYLIIFTIPGLLLFIVPTVRLGGGGAAPSTPGGSGAGGWSSRSRSSSSSSAGPPRHMGGHQLPTARTYRNDAEGELLLMEDLTAGVEAIADDFVASRQRDRDGASSGGRRPGGGGGGGDGLLAVGGRAGVDDGLGELADPEEDPTTPVTHVESPTKARGDREHERAAGAGAGASSASHPDDKEAMLQAARGWGAELGINSSYARSEKLYKLVRPHANLDMRLFLSLRGISKDCRYLAEGDGRVPNPQLANVANTALPEGFTIGRRRSRGLLAAAEAERAGAGGRRGSRENRVTGGEIFSTGGTPTHAEREEGSAGAAAERGKAGDGRTAGRALRSLDVVDGASDTISVGNAGVGAMGGFPSVAPKCKLRWSTGRDGKEMSTTPMEFRLRHVDRRQTLELETQFLPNLPKSDYKGHFRTCAVVANGGVHLRATKGAEIDAHEAVFRINYAPISGPAATGHDLAAHVGQRTTFDVVNRPNSDMLLKGTHSWRRPEKQPHTPAAGDYRRDAHLRSSRPAALILGEPLIRDARREQFLPLLLGNRDKEIYIVTPEMVYTFRYVWHELKKVVESRHAGVKYNDKPMTGWTTVMVALQMCDSVSLYGFMAYKGGRREERYHYFDRVAASLKVHSFDLAIEVFKLLALQYPVHIVDPNDTDAAAGGGGE